MDEVGSADVGIFGLSVSGLKQAWDDYMAQASSGNLTGEINFVPFLPFLSSKHNWPVSPIEIKDAAEARGVNTTEDLEFARARYAQLGKR
jgi:bifunctional UDP-N-acetylglucosamine pyrophosphorylase/glucosamine-1-phosphate N-acetyltransferase